MALIFLACASDPCADYCRAAEDFFAACVRSEGPEWSAPLGYANAADFANACDTWSWELARLDQTSACKLGRLDTLTCDDIFLLWELP